MVGDGSSDLSTRDYVDLFVGFGGVIARDNVMSKAPIALESKSIAPILPLAAGYSGYKRVIGTPHQLVFEKGIDLLFSQQTRFNQPNLEATIKREFDSIYVFIKQ